jgi:hypothetical protein
MGGACSVHRDMRNAYDIFVVKSEGKRLLEDCSIDERIILK